MNEKKEKFMLESMRDSEVAQGAIALIMAQAITDLFDRVFASNIMSDETRAHTIAMSIKYLSDKYGEKLNSIGVGMGIAEVTMKTDPSKKKSKKSSTLDKESAEIKSALDEIIATDEPSDETVDKFIERVIAYEGDHEELTKVKDTITTLRGKISDEQLREATVFVSKLAHKINSK